MRFKAPEIFRNGLVIPEDIREAMGFGVGTKFVVIGSGDTVFLKRIGRPSPAEFKKLLAESHKHARKMGFKKSDVERVIREVRRKK